MAPAATAAHAALVQYVEDHLAEPPQDDESASPVGRSNLMFRVGPFRFLLAGADAGGATRDTASCMHGAELVPPQFRAHLDAAGGVMMGADTVWLAGGCLAIAGCVCEGHREIDMANVRQRELRSEAPWIAGTLADPPAFVLDPLALELHFRRRGARRV